MSGFHSLFSMQKPSSGQQYRRLTRGGGVWEIVSVRPVASGLDHALLRRNDDPHTFKTLALTALMDRGQFEPVGHA